MSHALATVVAQVVAYITHKVVFTRKNNENADSALDVYATLDSIEGQAVDLNAEGTFCANADFDMPVTCKLYEVRDVVLPSWLSVAEWSVNHIAYNYMWNRGVNPAWPEAWQRGLLKLQAVEQVACAKLLSTKNFKSNFRASMCTQLKTWLEQEPSERAYNNPFSSRQWDCVVDAYTARDAKRIDNDLYYSNRHRTDTGIPHRYREVANDTAPAAAPFKVKRPAEMGQDATVD